MTGPLQRARHTLMVARALVDHSPSGPNIKALEVAQTHMDYLLDTLPIPSPSTPDGPGAPGPGPSVSSSTKSEDEEDEDYGELNAMAPAKEES